MFVDLKNSSCPCTCSGTPHCTHVHKVEGLSVPVVYYEGRPYTIQAMQQCAYFWQAVGEEVGVMHRCSKYQEGGFTGVIYCPEHLDYIKRREAGQKERNAKELLKNIEVNFDEIF